MQIVLVDFMSLDGVVQAPGGPEETPTAARRVLFAIVTAERGDGTLTRHGLRGLVAEIERFWLEQALLPI